MRKGESRYSKAAISFFPINERVMPIEEFRDVTDLMVPGVLPYYMISNYGRLFHKFSNQFLSVNIDTKGYPYKPLATMDGPKNVRIHRLVMLAFCYYIGCEDKIINHKDGIKCHPYIWNLEWSDYSENAIHAVQNNLLPTQAIYKERKIRKVCELLENPANSLQSIAEKTGVSYSIVSAIQQKRVHTDISDQYNIQSRKVNNNLSTDQVNMLCKYYENHPKQGTLDQHSKAALESIGFKDPSSREIRTAKKILTKESYRYISREYDF